MTNRKKHRLFRRFLLGVTVVCLFFLGLEYHRMLEQRKQQEELLLIKYEQVTAKLIAGDGKVYNAEIFDDSMPYRYCVSAPKGEYNFVVEAETDEGNHVTITSLLALDTNMEKDINDIVKVVFTVDAKTESTADGAGEIKSTAAGKTLQYLDFKLTLTVNDEPPTDIGDTNKQLLKIIVPFARGDKQNITVYRYHNGSIDTLTESRNEDGEGIDVGEDSITIYAMKFSTYAIGYVQPEKADGGSKEPSTGQGDSHNENNSAQNGSGFTDSDLSTTKSGRDKEPKTGDSTSVLPLATTGMIAGVGYFLDLFWEHKGRSFGIAEAQKNRAAVN